MKKLNIQNLANKFNLNETEKSILIFIERHAKDIKELGVRGVAKQCYTSPATIVNLAKKMNFSGYSELVFKMKENTLLEEVAHPAEVTALPYYQKLSERYVDEFEQILNDYQDKTIMILGSGFSQIIANYLNESLILKGFRSITNSHLELIGKEYAGETLLVVVTESGETARLKELVKQAYDNSVDVLSFVGNANSGIANYSRLSVATYDDIQFSSTPHEPHLFYGSILLVFELLLSAYLKRSIS
ncbi:MurR/RpiR family transcriptional regulator [Pisciglobus halotolerans]|uniref:DNA-binding transcriptional regulator, MurR/RpiR family, contains HTH and SIS domains n=1 Tax=Pisciglobus halotolerans TaxID=745365 RepID=A0A1I3AYT2_9LACT|nr:SIS domain-containing protein [Pisciglobus halotolerans]SFH55080.1 DNA-binding transcriptional regulator, MurR/RpiR family, contains HTH and SIS domains [Pisciglobus halotolerans]